MAAPLFETLDHIRAIVTDQVPEGITLEYKDSAILTRSDAANVLCKTVTAFANSIGGQFIVGIKSDAGRPVALDGGVPGKSRLDWIHTIINGSTYPAVELVDVREFQESTGSYYIISVPASIHAPHQSNDKRYYKRRGTHSEPMEHYEIEDIRNRPKQPLAPLRIELVTRDQLAFLYFKNDHSGDSIQNINCVVDANFNFERDGITVLGERGLRELRAGVERYFLLDSVPMMIEKITEPELHVRVTYEFHARTVTDGASFYLADLVESAIVYSPTVKALKALTEKIDRTSGHLEKIGRDIQKLTTLVDGTGLRISQRTLRALRNMDHLFDPPEFGWDGYKIILDISSDQALKLDHVFGVLDNSENRRRRYEALDPELRNKFEKRFKVTFE